MDDHPVSVQTRPGELVSGGGNHGGLRVDGQVELDGPVIRPPEGCVRWNPKPVTAIIRGGRCRFVTSSSTEGK